jgi:hypothetical protein
VKCNATPFKYPIDSRESEVRNEYEYT